MNTVYPILEEKIILGFLKDTFNENFNLENFIKPDKEFVLNIFTQFLEILGVKDYLKIEPKLMEGVENPEEYINTFPLISITKCIRFMVEKKGVSDFSLLDLIRPKRKRTQIIISQLIGIFLDFAETKERIFSQTKVDVKELQIKKEALLLKNSELKDLEMKKKSQLEDLRIETRPILVKKNNLIASIKECKQNSDDLLEEKEKVKKNVTQNKIVLSDLEKEKTQLKIKIKELQEQCITNIDIVKTLENKKQLLEELRAENLKLNNDIISNSTYYKKILEIYDMDELTDNKLNEIESNFELVLKPLNDILKDKNSSIKTIQELIGQLETLHKDMISIEENYKRKFKSLDTVFQIKYERIHNLNMDIKKKKEEKNEDYNIYIMKNQIRRCENDIILYENMYKKLLETLEQSKQLIQNKILEKKIQFN